MFLYGSLCHQSLYLVDGLGLVYIDFLYAFHSKGSKEIIPVDARELRFQFVVCHLVVVGSRVAHLHSAVRCFGDSCLDVEDISHFLQSFFLGESAKGEHLDNVLLVGFTNGCSCLVCVEVIVLLPQRQSSLSYLHDVLLAIHHIGSDVYPEISVNAVEREVYHFLCQLVARLDGSDSFQRGAYGLDAFVVAANGIHIDFV